MEFELRRSELRETEKREREARFEADVKAAAKMESPDESRAAIEKLRKSRDKEARKYSQSVHKQDRVFFVALYILYNLAEDVATERKMVKKDLLQTLEGLLSL